MSLSRARRNVRVAALLCIALASTALPAWAQTNVEVGGDAYVWLLRLEAQGLTHSSLLGQRPLVRSEVLRLAREATESSPDASPVDRALAGMLTEEFSSPAKPLRARAGYVYTDDGRGTLNYNNSGDEYFRGSNARINLSGGFDRERIALRVSASIRAQEGRASEAELDSSYLMLSTGRWDLELGRDTGWWGHGEHGSILLSDNARPFDMLRISNRHPMGAGFLGPSRYVFFATRLESDRHVPNPYLYGMRFDFKPSQYFEFALQRTAIFGGEGRPSGLDTFIRSLLFQDENNGPLTAEEPGDQRAGFALKFIVPNSVQPFVLYYEEAGEDSKPDTRIPYIDEKILGVYMPAVFSSDATDLRAEYAYNSSSDRRNAKAWYNHRIYRTGYRYYGRVIGHHMDTDSEDFYLELRRLMPSMRGWALVSLDWERSNLALTKPIGSYHDMALDPNLPKKTELSFAFSLGVGGSASLSGNLTTAWLNDTQYVGQKDRANLVELFAEYAF